MSKLKAKQANFAVYLHYRTGLDWPEAGIYVLEDATDNNVVAAQIGYRRELRTYQLDADLADQDEIYCARQQGTWLYYV